MGLKRGRPKKNPVEFIFNEDDNKSDDLIVIDESDLTEQKNEDQTEDIDPKSWRTYKNKQMSITNDIRIDEDQRLIAALSKYSPYIVWALQCYSIIPNVEMLYRCTHVIKDTDNPSSIRRKSTTFLNNDDVKLIIEHSKKNFLKKDCFIPLERKKQIIDIQEEEYANGILDENGNIPEVDKEEMLRIMDKRIRRNPMDDSAAKVITELRFMKKQDEQKEEDVFNKLTHFAVHRSCDKNDCEFRIHDKCIGCFINRLEENELNEEELDWYEDYMNNK